MKTRKPHPSGAFSLIELLLSMTILSGLLLMFVGLLDQTRLSWQSAQGRVSQFREARTAFEIITKNLSQASLNSYFDQVDEDENGIPEAYEITSELHFKVMQADKLPLTGDKPGHAIFFQAPLGVVDNPEYGALSNLMNARGYYVIFGSDKEFKPPFISSSYEEKNRYRLMEYLPPTEYNSVYIDHQEDIDKPANLPKFDSWYNDKSLLETYSRPLAENIVAIIFSPREPLGDVSKGSSSLELRKAVASIAPNYEFDSELGEPGTQKRFKHQLPPLVNVTLIAIDEKSALRLDELNQGTAYIDNYTGGNWLNSAEAYHSDIQTLISQFNAENQAENGLDISYKIFSTTVSILASKYSLADQN